MEAPGKKKGVIIGDYSNNKGHQLKNSQYEIHRQSLLIYEQGFHEETQKES